MSVTTDRDSDDDSIHKERLSRGLLLIAVAVGLAIVSLLVYAIALGTYLAVTTSGGDGTVAGNVAVLIASVWWVIAGIYALGYAPEVVSGKAKEWGWIE